MDPQLIVQLEGILGQELTAANFYLLAHAQCELWGLGRLADKFKEEHLEETHHAEDLIEHIISFDAPISLNAQALTPYKSVTELFDMAIAAEESVTTSLRAAMKTASSAVDWITYALLGEMLCDTDETLDYLEAQRKLITLCGEAAYLTTQVHPAPPAP